MSKVAISGNASGTGTLTIAAPNTNSNSTLNLPDGSGTFTVNGVNSNIVSGTAIASTSGTSIDFTSLPSWIKRITVMFASVSTSGTSEYLIQIGTSGGIQTSGYSGASSYVGGGANTINMSTGFTIRSDDSGEVHHGIATLCLLNSSTGLWVMNSVLGHSNEVYTTLSGGSKTLSGTLDRVRLTTVNGTDTFDAGSISILYE